MNNSPSTINEETLTKYDNLIDSSNVYIIANLDKAQGMWLATLDSEDNEKVFYADSYNIGTLYWDGMSGFGLRPFVHLTSDIKVAGQDSNGVWQIVQ